MARVSSFTRLLSSKPLEAALADAAPLHPDDAAFLRESISDLQFYRAGSEIPVTSHTRVVLSGWTAFIAQLVDGRRQMVSLALPGELLPEVLEDRPALSILALTDCQIADCSAIAAVAEAPDPPMRSLTQAWAKLQRDARARAIRHTIRLGRLAAYERMASFLLELHERLQRSGATDATSMPMPLTQEALADCLGLSVVHVNRTLQQLRRDRAIVYRAGFIVFPDLPALRDIAQV